MINNTATVTKKWDLYEMTYNPFNDFIVNYIWEKDVCEDKARNTYRKILELQNMWFSLDDIKIQDEKWYSQKFGFIIK